MLLASSGGELKEKIAKKPFKFLNVVRKINLSKSSSPDLTQVFDTIITYHMISSICGGCHYALKTLYYTVKRSQVDFYVFLLK